MDECPLESSSVSSFCLTAVGSHVCLDTSGCPLSQHHYFSAGFILLHAAMRLNDFVEVERFANLDTQCARRDLLSKILKRHPHEVFRFACVCCQADRCGYCLHGSEILEGPLVADD